MQIEQIPELALTAADDRAIAVLLERAFSPAFKGKSYYKQRHTLRIVARDPAIVGHIALHFRAVLIGRTHTEIVGLAEVGTDPDRRGRGIAGRLLADGIAVAQQSLAHWVFLFGDAPMYAAAGFRAVPNMVRHLALTDAGTGTVAMLPDASLMVLPLRGGTWDDGGIVDLMGHTF